MRRNRGWWDANPFRPRFPPTPEQFLGGFRPGIFVPYPLLKRSSVAQMALSRDESWATRHWPPGGSQRNFPVGGACSRPGGRVRGPGGGRFLARTGSGACERRRRRRPTLGPSQPAAPGPGRPLPASATTSAPATADAAEAGAAGSAATWPCPARRGPEPRRGR